jgi:hypothetical protein
MQEMYIHKICFKFDFILTWNKIHTILTSMNADQDPVMPVALERVFPYTIHQSCLWHVQNRYMPFLNEMYARFEEMDFKTRFQSIIHHPLTELEFETAWSMLLEDFYLHDNITLNKLYGICKDWVPTFYTT